MTNPFDPVTKFRFAVQIQGVTVGWFTECSGLTVEREVISQPEGGINDLVHQLPGRVKQSHIILKRGLADNALWDWFDQGLYDGNVAYRDVSIVLYSPDLKQKKQWDLTKAYPVKWTGPDFQSDSTQAAIETVDLVHHGLKMIDWTSNELERSV